MKKLVIFLSLSLIFLVVGCQKEEIRPNTIEQMTSDSENEKSLGAKGSRDGGNGRPIDTITDPNNDEDEDDKIKK